MSASVLANLLGSALAAGQAPLPAVDRSAMEPQVARLLADVEAGLRDRIEAPEAWLAYGETLHAHGLVRPAATAYREAALRTEPGSQLALSAGYLLAHAVRGSAPGEARAALEGVLRRHPGYAPAHVLHGELLEETGDRAGAAAAFEAALLVTPGAPLALFRLGQMRLLAGNPDDAIPLLEQALAAEPDAGAVRSELARAWTLAGDRERAGATLAEGGDAGLPGIEDPIHFRMSSRDVSSPRLLARAREARTEGDLETARSRYAELSEIRPRDAVVLAEYGAVLDALGQFGAAERRLGDAVALDPDSFLARLALGLLHLRAGDLPGAEFHLRRATAARPDSGAAHRALGDALLRQRRVDEALAALKEASRLDPADGSARVLSAAALAELGRFGEAWEAVREARDRGATVPEPFLAALRARSPEPSRS